MVNRDADVLAHIVARSCELKAQVVRDDELETTGLRAILNYGHTYGHAFEALAGYGDLLHGEAVSIGMICASRVAFQPMTPLVKPRCWRPSICRSMFRTL